MLVKIVGVSVLEFRRPLDGRSWNPTMRWHERRAPLLVLETDQGLAGVGEAWSRQDRIDLVLDALADDVALALLGTDALARPPIARRGAAQPAYAAPWVGTAAASAVDIALWDLAAQAAEQPLWRALVQRLAAAGRVVVSGATVHLPAHGVQLSALDERLAQKVMPRLLAAGFEGVWARDLAKEAGEPEALVRTTLARLAQRGELFQVVKDLYHAPPAIQALARIARESAADGDVKAAEFRDRSGLGRKRAIQVLEFFDKVGLLRRVGDAHRLRNDCQLFMEEDGTTAAAHPHEHPTPQQRRGNDPGGSAGLQIR